MRTGRSESHHMIGLMHYIHQRISICCLYELYTLRTQQIYQSNGMKNTFKTCGIIQASLYFILTVVLSKVVDPVVAGVTVSA